MLKDYYFIPGATRNLISISVLAQKGYEFKFCKYFYNILLDKIMITKALLINGLYHLLVDAEISNNEQSMKIVNKRHLKDNFNLKYLWHLRLGYIAEDRLNRLQKDEILHLSFDSI